MVDNSPDDPFAPRDGTVLRPRPGAGRRPGADGGAVGTPGFGQPRTVVPGGTQPDFGGPGSGAQGGGAASGSAAAGNGSGAGYGASGVGVGGAGLGGSSASLTDFIVGASNPIIQSAAPLLTLASRLATSVQQVSITTLRQQAVQEIRAFEDRLRDAGVGREDSLVSRYVLCTFVDSAVLNTPWGAQGDWASQSLLVLFHKEVSGGEKFFEILERVRAEPGRYIDLIELLFVCLALGYEGKYRHDPNGQTRLADLQHDLYRIIRDRRQLRDEELAAHWKGVEDRRNPIMQYVPWWMVAVACLAVLAITFVILHARLGYQAEPIKAALAAPAIRVNYPAAAPQHASRLKELLAHEELAGRLTVEEFGDKTVVTLTAPNLFRSGSARVNPDLYPTLREIALALNQVPGRVIIVGHTDDQPVRSLQFADNIDLSRARAVAVADVLKPALAAFGRVEWQGVGSTQPRYQPVDTAENRARNRRVEIIQIEPSSGRSRP